MNDVIDMDAILGGRNDILRSRAFRKKLKAHKASLSEKSSKMARQRNPQPFEVSAMRQEAKRTGLILEAQKNRKLLRGKGFFNQSRGRSSYKIGK